MKRLLVIEVSPRHEASYSTKIGAQALKSFADSFPEVTIDKINLWEEKLPEFNGETLNAKYAILRKKDHTEAQAQAWQQVSDIATRLKTADYIMITSPVWNRGAPYKLKHYIDLVTQPGITFSFSPEEGYKGLVADKPVLVISASAGAFTGESPLKEKDFFYFHLKDWFEFIGITNVSRVEMAPAIGPEDIIFSALKNAVNAVNEWVKALENSHA